MMIILEKKQTDEQKCKKIRPAVRPCVLRFFVLSISLYADMPAKKNSTEKIQEKSDQQPDHVSFFSSFKVYLSMRTCAEKKI